MNPLTKKHPKRWQSSHFWRSVWAPLTVGLGLLAFMVFIRFLMEKKTPSEPSQTVVEVPKTEALQGILREIFGSRGIAWDFQARRGKGYDEWRVHVPAELPVASLHLAIQEGVSRAGARILYAESEPVSGRVSLRIGWQDSCFVRVHLFRGGDAPKEEGRIALLIDDFGDRWDAFVRSFAELGVNITVSVLPGRKMSARVAREMRRRGCEIILHLPMEPLNPPFQNDGRIILSQMDRKEIRRILQRGLDEVPDAVGVNNHMGSKVTQDRRIMSDLCEELRSMNLYFVDSRTTAATVAYETARMMDLRCAQRDVFLDVEYQRNVIRQALWDLARIAKQNGFSVGIGHCHRTTLEVLREEIPKLLSRGYRFVAVSEVVN